MKLLRNYFTEITFLCVNKNFTCMSPNKAEAAVHGCHCSCDMAVHMRKVLAHTAELGIPVPRATRSS